MDRHHFHEFFEINYVLSGDVRFFVADQIYQVQSGSLLVFNHTDLHRSVSPPGTLYERMVLHFAPEDVLGLSSSQTNLLGCFLNRPPHFSSCIQLCAEQSSTLVPMLDKAAHYQDKIAFGSDVYRRIALAEILVFVNKLFSSYSKMQPLRSEPEMKKVLPMLLYIQEHLDEDLSLERLAKRFYISKYHINHIFKRAIGFTPNEYIINRRIMKARELLIKGDLSIQRIGESVGFNNNSHFIRTFKALVGKSPKQYSLAAYQKTESR